MRIESPNTERNARRRVERGNLRNAARCVDVTSVERHDLGRTEVECPFCQAKMWLEDRLTDSSKINPKFGLCFNKGGYTVQELKATHSTIHNLLSGNTAESRDFKSNFRVYNSKFNFTSLGVTLISVL
jgi:hypothetical protein